MPRAKKKKRSDWGSPWLRSDRDVWYLGKEPLVDRDGNFIRGEDNKAKAMEVWHEIMSTKDEAALGAAHLVKKILDNYLRHSQTHISSKTFESYKGYFESFVEWQPHLTIREFKSPIIEQWWREKHSKWGPSTRNLCGAAFKAAMRWAYEQDRSIPHNPLMGWKLPTMKKKSGDVVVTDGEFASVMAVIDDECLRDILTVLWWSATRPINLIRATRANFKNGKILELAEHKTAKKTGRPTKVYLPTEAKTIVEKLVQRYPDGPLFRSPNGERWTAHKLANSVHYYADKVGLAGRFTPYSCRHTKATRLLESGKSPGDVAAYLGNSPNIVQRNYSHVQDNLDRMNQIGEEVI